MKAYSFEENIEYDDKRIKTQVILETLFSKEIRILLKKGQVMKEHKAPFPIVVHVLEGEINFGVNEEVLMMKKGSIITLDANVPHDLTANEDSMVRLTLSKNDTVSRVENVIKD